MQIYQSEIIALMMDFNHQSLSELKQTYLDASFEIKKNRSKYHRAVSIANPNPYKIIDIEEEYHAIYKKRLAISCLLAEKMNK